MQMIRTLFTRFAKGNARVGRSAIFYIAGLWISFPLHILINLGPMIFHMLSWNLYINCDEAENVLDI